MKTHTILLLSFALLGLCTMISPAHAQSGPGGGRWIRQDSLTREGVGWQDVAAADSLHVVAAGFSLQTSVVRRTTDGGQHWTTVWADSNYKPKSAAFHYALFARHVAHPTPTRYVVALDSGIVIRSADGGQTWQSAQVTAPTSDDSRAYIWALSMADSLHGIVTAYRQMYSTDDGGVSWQSIPLPEFAGAELPDSLTYVPTSVVSLGEHTYVALLRTGDRQPYVARTVDGGQHWTVAAVDSIVSVWFADSLNGWGAGYGSTGEANSYKVDIIARTTDGGRTWQSVLHEAIEPRYGLYDVQFADDRNGMAVGLAQKVVFTTDGGASWKRVDSATFDPRVGIPFTAVTYPSPGRAWVVTGGGQIWHYTTAPPASVGNEPMKLPTSGTLQLTDRRDGTASIRFHAPGDGLITLGIYDVTGRLVSYPYVGTTPPDVAVVPCRFPGPGAYIVDLSRDGRSVATIKTLVTW